MQVLSVFLFLTGVYQIPLAVLPAGTRVAARLETRVETASSNEGDIIVAVVAEPVRTGGRVVIPGGSRLSGRIETVQPADSTIEGRVRLVFREIEFPDGRKLPTWITNAFSASPPNRKLRYALYVGIGGVVGALVGGKAARTTGVLGGSLIGFVIAGNSGNGNLPDLVLKPGQMLRLQLGEELRLE